MKKLRYISVIQSILCFIAFIAFLFTPNIPAIIWGFVAFLLSLQLNLSYNENKNTIG